MDIYEIHDLKASCFDYQPLILDRTQVVWKGTPVANKDRAAETAMAELNYIKTRPCDHCGRQADFVEFTDYGHVNWCSILEAQAFYSRSYTRAI